MPVFGSQYTGSLVEFRAGTEVSPNSLTEKRQIYVTQQFPAVMYRGDLPSEGFEVTSSDKTEHFVQQLATHQNRLYGYVFSLLGDHSRTADVLQETNMVLWRKIDEFQTDKAFLPWAFAIARFQVLAHLRDKKRDRLLLDAELAESISEETERQAEHLDQLRAALRPCMTTLTAGNRDLVERRYFRAMSISDIAREVDRTVSAVKVALLRSRRHLSACIERRLLAEGDA